MTSDSIVPFWQRLRDITLYPAHSAAMFSIVVLALLSLLTALPGFGGLILRLVIAAATYKYAFEVLRASANGRLEPPEGGLGMSDSMGYGAIGLQIVLVVICVLSFFGGVVVGSIVSLIVVFALPGITMSYAMDESILNAINPSTWLTIMSRIGGGYFLAFAIMLVIMVSSANAQSLVEEVIPWFIARPLVNFVSIYALIAVFHLMGYLIYQYHEELGYEPETTQPLSRSSNDPDQQMLDEVAEMVRDGETDMALDAMRGHVRSRGGSEAVHVQYRKLLRLKDEQPELIRHGKEWLAILLAQDKERAAVDLARELCELDPTFFPADAESNTRLAQRAAALGNAQLALRLVNGFNKRFPKSSDIPGNYLLAARLLSERMGKDAEARTLLNQLKGAYPQHPLIPEIDALLKIIDNAGTRKLAKN